MRRAKASGKTVAALPSCKRRAAPTPPWRWRRLPVQFGQDFTGFYFLAVAHEDAFDDRSFGGPKAR